MDTILRVEDLRVWFPVRSGFLEAIFSKDQKWVKAVDGISFDVRRGEIFCLVGESGCGKTTTGKAIVHLNKPTSGRIFYQAKEQELEEIRIYRQKLDEIRRALEVSGVEEAFLAVQGLKRHLDGLKEERDALRGIPILSPEEEVILQAQELEVARLAELAKAHPNDEREKYRFRLAQERLEGMRATKRPLTPEESTRLGQLEQEMEEVRRQGGLALQALELEEYVAFLEEKYDVTQKEGVELRELRRKVQMVFQDPYESLNPKHSIFDIVAEPLVVNHIVRSQAELEIIVSKALEDAGLRPASDFRFRFPHELSGGQRQRVGVASSLVVEPEFIVADEPVSMLDASVRTEILKLLMDLRHKKDLTFIFITHDLSLAWVIADRIAVLYLGKIVEMGPVTEVIQNPRHPYTKALISVVPSPDPTKKKQAIILKGERPDPIDVPAGCRFHPRCPMAIEICGWEARDISSELLGIMEGEVQAHVDAVVGPMKASLAAAVAPGLESLKVRVTQTLQQLPPGRTPEEDAARADLREAIIRYLDDASKALQHQDGREVMARLDRVAEKLSQLKLKALAKEAPGSLRAPLEALQETEALARPPEGVDPHGLEQHLVKLYAKAQSLGIQQPPADLMKAMVEDMVPEGDFRLDIHLVPADEGRWEAFDAWLRSNLQARLKEKVAFRAITSVVRQGNVISITMREVGEPALKQVAPETYAACVLV